MCMCVCVCRTYIHTSGIQTQMLTEKWIALDLFMCIYLGPVFLLVVFNAQCTAYSAQCTTYILYLVHRVMEEYAFEDVCDDSKLFVRFPGSQIWYIVRVFVVVFIFLHLTPTHYIFLAMASSQNITLVVLGYVKQIRWLEKTTILNSTLSSTPHIHLYT